MRAKFSFLLAVISGLLAGGLLWYARSSPAQDITKGIINSPKSVLSVTSDRTNIALLGVGGEGHEGGELTDSILIASIYHPTNQVSLISIPRDVWVQELKSKINAIYYYGEQIVPGGGLARTKEALTLVTGLPIHYSLLIDFSGFIKAIDAVGGLTLDVERTFDDYKYPIPGKENVEPESDRYEHVHFEAGKTTMDGVTALKYVRSRHALGEEGTDFARSSRQQKVIRAFLSQLISKRTVFNPERINTLKSTISDSLKTDISDSAIPAFTKIGLGINFDSIKTISIESELVHPNELARYGGQWVLLPIKSWEEVHSYVQENLAK